MPDDPKRDEAEAEAEMAAVYYQRLLDRGVDERAAREMAVGYTIARQRRERREPWEFGTE